MGEVVNIGEYNKEFCQKRIGEIQGLLTVYNGRVKLLEQELKNVGDAVLMEAKQEDLSDARQQVATLNRELAQLQEAMSGNQE